MLRDKRVPANPQVQLETRAHFPVVLSIKRRSVGGVARNLAITLKERVHIARDEIRQSVRGELAIESEPGILLERSVAVHLRMHPVHTKRQLMRSLCDSEFVAERRDVGIYPSRD